MNKKSTDFCDIDGTIVMHRKFEDLDSVPAELTPHATKINDWHDAGHHIILTTARPESLRELTVAELEGLGLKWSRLIMGIGRGPRILINDEEPSGSGPKAIAFSLQRNSGFANVTPDCLNN